MSIKEKFQDAYQNQAWAEIITLFPQLPNKLRQSADSRTMLAVAHYYQEEFDQAQKLLESVNQEFPNNWGVLCNLARNAAAMGDDNATLTYYQQAHHADPNEVEPLFRLGQLYSRLGDYAKGGDALNKVLERNPQHAQAQLILMDMYFDLLPPERWSGLVNMVQNPHQLDTFMHGIYNLRLMVIEWLLAQDSAKIAQHHQALNQLVDELKAKPSTFVGNNRKSGESSVRSLQGYRHFFDALLSAQALAPAIEPSLPKLYIVGDSHCLPPHRQTLNWQGKKHQIESLIVTGLKCWHFVSPQPNAQRNSFLARIKNVPATAPLVISAGEIDTRINEGIMNVAQKSGEPLDVAMRNTFVPAMAWLKLHLANYTDVTIAGIPAPHADNLTQTGLAQEDWPAYAKYMELANNTLGEQAKANGFKFADLAALTRDPATLLFADNGHNLDGRHLMPHSLPQALEQP